MKKGVQLQAFRVVLVVAAFVLVLYSRPAGTVIMINRNRTYGIRFTENAIRSPRAARFGAVCS